jgi:hypothetical protein
MALRPAHRYLPSNHIENEEHWGLCPLSLLGMGPRDLCGCFHPKIIIVIRFLNLGSIFLLGRRSTRYRRDSGRATPRDYFTTRSKCNSLGGVGSRRIPCCDTDLIPTEEFTRNLPVEFVGQTLGRSPHDIHAYRRYKLTRSSSRFKEWPRHSMSVFAKDGSQPRAWGASVLVLADATINAGACCGWGSLRSTFDLTGPVPPPDLP